MERLYEKLRMNAESDYYPFHMPGHKRNSILLRGKFPYDIDITEIDGFDDLHHAAGILKEAEERAACLYKAEETHYLVNGSTVGILSAILGCTNRGDQILMARNCHKSVYNAVLLNELYPVYLYPSFDREMELCGEINVSDVEYMLERNPEIKAVVITSPTYDGVVSDVRNIALAVHRKGIPLIVDEAHGAHFGFHPYFPQNSNVSGADVVIHSLHKTLPSLTQTALIHINGNIADRMRIRRYLHMLQSSSPSYVLMAGMDECIRLLSDNGYDIFDRYTELLERTRSRLDALKNMSLLSTDNYDRSKLVVSVRNTQSSDLKIKKAFSGKLLYEILLRRYHLQLEMAAGSYVLAMTSFCDTRQGMERLVKALDETDGMLEKTDMYGMQISVGNEKDAFYRHQMIYTPSEAEKKKNIIEISWQQASGKTAMDFAYLYPPGIPLVVPGEKIAQETADQICRYMKMGFTIEGSQKKGKIRVLADG